MRKAHFDNKTGPRKKASNLSEVIRGCSDIAVTGRVVIGFLSFFGGLRGRNRTDCTPKL